MGTLMLLQEKNDPNDKTLPTLKRGLCFAGDDPRLPRK